MAVQRYGNEEARRAEEERLRKEAEERARQSGQNGWSTPQGGTTPEGAVPGATGVKVVSTGAGTGVTMAEIEADRAAKGLPPPAASGVGSVNVDSAFYDDLKRQYATDAPRTAPTVAPTTIAPARSTPVATVAAPVGLNIPNVGPAPTINAPGAIVAQRIGAQSIAPVGNVTAERVTGETIDPAYAAALRDRMAGRGPSVADETLRMALDRNARASLGAAAQARGNDRAAARRGAIFSNSELTGQAAQTAALAKAQEAADASGQLGQALFKQADLRQGANTFSADLAARAALANQGKDVTLGVRGAELRQEADVESGRLALAADTATAGNVKDIGIAQAGIQADIQKLQAEIALRGGIATMEQDAEMKRLQAQLAQGAANLDTSEAGATARAQGDIDSRTALANADNALKQQGLDDQRRAVVLDAITRIQSTMTTASIADKQMALQIRLAQMGMKQNEINGILGLVSTALAVGGTIGGAVAGGPAGAAVGGAVGGAAGGVLV
jgi:hypothetical protein